jgi:hypothetical protein
MSAKKAFPQPRSNAGRPVLGLIGLMRRRLLEAGKGKARRNRPARSCPGRGSSSSAGALDNAGQIRRHGPGIAGQLTAGCCCLRRRSPRRSQARRRWRNRVSRPAPAWTERKVQVAQDGIARTFRQLMRFDASSVLCLSLALLLAAGGACAQEVQPSEYQLKAAFLFNFAKFVEWPEEAFSAPDAPMVIGVLGENPFGEHLEQTIRGKTINNRPLVVKELRSQAEARGCHIVFIGSSEKTRLPEVFESLRGASVLTVGETERFTEAGGMINFVLDGGKIRFQVNDTAAKSARLKISSKLLSLAQRPAH